MFERYTERARRVLFFARYEATQLGSTSIETEHLLLGLIREGKGLTSRIFARSHLSLESIRKDIEGRTVFRRVHALRAQRAWLGRRFETASRRSGCS
jgi:ATP-dependent Clp protease ATP-binding subunit ClpC